MGTEERRMRVKGVSVLLLGDKSWKREAMRVYWVDNFTARDDVFAW